MIETILRVAAITVITVTAFIVGLYVGLNDSPKPVKGVYNIEYHKDSGNVIVTTRIDYIEQDGDKLIVNGKPTFNKVQ